VIAENDPEEQEKAIKFNTLVADLVMYQTTLDIVQRVAAKKTPRRAWPSGVSVVAQVREGQVVVTNNDDHAVAVPVPSVCGRRPGRQPVRCRAGIRLPR
jgi:hypothetical protein